MKKIGIISDTHSYLTDSVYTFFADCDEIWHAGDVGNIDVLNLLSTFKPLKCVYGNIDGYDIRIRTKESLNFKCEKVSVFLTHIAGYVGKYEKIALQKINEFNPNLLICGHSHILRVMFDKKHNLLLINPGAAGKYGFHEMQTMIRLKIEDNRIYDLEIWEKPKSSIINKLNINVI